MSGLRRLSTSSRAALPLCTLRPRCGAGCCRSTCQIRASLPSGLPFICLRPRSGRQSRLRCNQCFKWPGNSKIVSVGARSRARGRGAAGRPRGGGVGSMNVRAASTAVNASTAGGEKGGGGAGREADKRDKRDDPGRRGASVGNAGRLRGMRA